LLSAVCPGPIFTRFHERRAADAGKSAEEFRTEFGRGTMLKRPGTPAEVAACILFLGSDEASDVTGASLVGGGALSCSGPCTGPRTAPAARSSWTAATSPSDDRSNRQGEISMNLRELF